MKQRNYLHDVFICMLFLCITACEKEKTSIEDELPVAIKSDFSARYPSAQITHFQEYSDNLGLIDFIDKEKNVASTWYADGTWEMTSTEINDMRQLPQKVQSTFYNLGYRDAQNIEIYKTERDKIAGLYILHFQYRWKKVENMEHYVFINDDGLYLTTFTWTPNDTRRLAKLPKDHLDFIAEKYNGAETRGYVNNGGHHQYFILHKDTIKCVSLRGEVATDKGFWQETRYELSIETKIPEHVIKVLKQNDPNFIYTHIYYIESEEGNSYLLQDKKRDDELGYYIRENYEPTEI